MAEGEHQKHPEELLIGLMEGPGLSLFTIFACRVYDYARRQAGQNAGQA